MCIKGFRAIPLRRIPRRAIPGYSEDPLRHFPGRFFVHAGQDVAIHREGERGGTMAEAVGHKPCVGAAPEEVARVSMPEVVEPDPGQANPPDQGLEVPADEVVGMERPAISLRKHEPAVLVGRTPGSTLCRLLGPQLA